MQVGVLPLYSFKSLIFFEKSAEDSGSVTVPVSNLWESDSWKAYFLFP